MIERHNNASLPGQTLSKRLENRCKFCLLLTVTQELTTDRHPNEYPIKLVREICAKEGDCTSGKSVCKIDDSTFERPKLIFEGQVVPVKIADDAEISCSCCDTDFCNGEGMIYTSLVIFIFLIKHMIFGRTNQRYPMQCYRKCG